jgi:hypothetical protein
VKRCAERAGYRAADFSARSLRSGLLTSAAARGASVFKVMEVSRHKSVDTLRGYVRSIEIFEDHAAEGLLSAIEPVSPRVLRDRQLPCRVASALTRHRQSGPGP